MQKRASCWRHWRSTVINLGTILCLLVAVSFLPADTSLSQIRERGVLKLCVPESYPPLVTGNPEQPGYDVELAKGIAKHLGVRLAVNTLPTIGRDFNPRNWMVTRAQCDMLGGGVADTLQTRNFMQTLPTGIELSWMLIAPSGELPAPGNTIVIIPGSSGLDRLQLSSFLRRNDLRPQPVQSVNDALKLLKDGQASALIAENFTACHLLQSAQSQVTASKDLPLKAVKLTLSAPDTPDTSPARTKSVQPSSYSMALSLWKGDLTLKRAVEKAMQTMARNSEVLHIHSLYFAGSGVKSSDCGDVVANN